MAYTDAIPVLPSPDVEASCAFLVDKLGFTLNFLWQAEEGGAPVYGGVHDGDIHLHFTLTPDESVCKQAVCRLYCDDIEGLYAKAQAHNIVHPNGALGERPWGEKDFTVLDQFGVCLHIAQELS